MLNGFHSWASGGVCMVARRRAGRKWRYTAIHGDTRRHDNVAMRAMQKTKAGA
jgi:hypothetical protein